MLQSIRDHTQGWIAGVVISLLIVSFALWGIHSYFVGGGSSDVIAKVNGVEITKEQLATVYERLRHQAQGQANSHVQLSDKIENRLKSQALSALVSNEVLKKASFDQGYRVSAQQLDSYIEQIPDFHVNGRFSNQQFQQVLASSMLSAREFLDLIKTNILIEQPRLGMVFTSFALPNEVEGAYALVGQERDIEYAVLSHNNLKQPIQVTTGQVQSYYEQNQDDFRSHEQVSIEYIQLSLADVMAKIQPSESTLKAFYHDQGTQEPYEKVKDKVKDTYIHQQAEEKFAAIKEKLANMTYEHPDSLVSAAKEFGVSIKKTGLFSKETGGTDISSNKKIRDIAFSDEVLIQKNNSDVIPLDSNQILVLRIGAHVPAAVLPLKEVQQQIENKLKAEEQEKRLSQLADEIKQKLQTGTASEVTSHYHLSWVSLGYMSRHSNKVDSAILDTAFDMPVSMSAGKKPSFGIAKFSQGYAVIIVKAAKPGVLPSADKDQYKLFAEQIQNAQASLEYELYKLSAMSKAKIKFEG